MQVYARAPGETTTCTVNSVKVDCTKIRMYGVDAPESKQTCLYQNGTEYPCGALHNILVAVLKSQALSRSKKGATLRH